MVHFDIMMPVSQFFPGGKSHTNTRYPKVIGVSAVAIVIQDIGCKRSWGFNKFCCNHGMQPNK